MIWLWLIPPGIAVIAVAGIVVIAIRCGGEMPFRESFAWTARGFLKGFCGYKTPKLRELEAQARENGIDIWKRPERRSR